jgi:hypothetical protein
MTPSSAATLATIISPAADRLAAFLVARSQTATTGDPEYDYDALLEASGLSADELADAADDLVEHDLIETEARMNGRRTPFDVLVAKDSLFVAFDALLGENDPEADARRLAADLLSEAVPSSVDGAAAQYDWTPRRMNPAITFLVDRGLVADDDLLGCHPWRQYGLLATRKLRRFLEGAE